VLDGAGKGNKVFDEEIFGPVVTAIPFKDSTDVAPAANETVYGLAAGIWTNDLRKAHRLIPQLRAGTVWVNTYNVFDAALPFGGYKQSGWGREMGEEVIHEYTETSRCASASEPLRRLTPGRARGPRFRDPRARAGPASERRRRGAA
jgi:phenylacetaldehyde dehydrogenase